MTTADRYMEIGQRITQLTELRAEYVVANEQLQKLAEGLKQARVEAEAVQRGDRLQSTAKWPTPEEFHAANDKVNRIRASAREVIDSLRGLGCDPELFKFAG